MPANPDVLNSPRCAGADAGNCDNFSLTIAPPAPTYGPYVVEIRLQPQGDWDMEIYNPDGKYRTGSGNGVYAAEVVTLYNPPAGTYRIAAFPFSPVVGTDGNSYAASAELKHQPPSGLAPPGTENVGYANFACPAGQTCTSGFGEPSIGVNWKTGNVLFAGGGSLKTYRINNFNDQTSPPSATWTNVSGNQHIATSPRLFADPILFTDSRTGRTFVDQLEGLTPFSTMEYTDDDGNLFIPSQGSGIASGVDHQTIGGGPLAAPLTRDPNLPRPAYPNGVYYCAQALGPANCALSLDGGETFGPAVETWTTECGGLHGHIKVAPDGTAYLPNKGCGGRQGMAVSTNNGITWTIRTIPGTGTGESDPSIGIATDGTVYFGFVDGDGHPKVAVSHDKGASWDTFSGNANFIDVGIPFGIQNAVFAAVVAGDPNRAAFTFHGTPTAGPFQDASFAGVWDLYVAQTYDGGRTWTTVKATSDPTQRGCIWLGGGDNPCRNLLDFMDATIDQVGRVIVGYADGCTGGCATDPNNTAKSVWATIARQSVGKRMFAQFDPVPSIATNTTLTSSPNPSTVGQAVTFTATVTAASGTPAGTVAFNDGAVALGTASLDSAGHATLTTSALSAGSHSITATYNGNDTYAPSTSAALVQTVTSNGNPTCTLPGVSLIVDPSGDTGTGSIPTVPGTPAQDITEVLVAEPFQTDGVNRLAFTLRLADLTALPASGIWRAFFTVGSTTYFVGAFNDPLSGMQFNYGTSGTITTTLGPADSGAVDITNKTITIFISNSKVGGPAAGATLTGIYGRTQTLVGSSTVGGATPTHDLAPNNAPGSGTASYTLIGNAACNTKIATATTLTSSPNPSTVGQAVTFIATVSASSGTPTGTVTFNDGGSALGLATLSSGQASFTTSTLSGGSHAITAAYSGDANFDASTSAPVTQVVQGGVQTGLPRYANYYPPAGIAENFGEPSIGANWISGKVMFFGGLTPYALRVGFDDKTSPATVTWFRTPLVSDTLPRAVGGDPILVTDKDTGRTFVSQLQGLTPTATMDITDNDGMNYTPTAGFGIGSGVDHQTIGVGPFHAPLPPGVVYKNAVYYCAQEGLNFSGDGIGNCALSVNGGITFGPAVPVYVANVYNSCSALHGHAKVAPDGTVYLPNRKCGDGAGMAYSEDNGVTWTAATVPNSSVGDSDASVGIATDGTVYIGYEGADGHAYAAVFNKTTKTFGPPTDVGAQLALQNAIFPAVVAGDPDRAAFAFYGSTSPGDQDDPAFRGDWYLFIATTFDHGQTWTTINATPNDPIQRDGICTRGFQGCVVPRNLLDFFDATVDKEGRVLVGYNDGCMGPCVESGPNSNTSKGVIARQSGGRRMFARYDPSEPTVPGAPRVTAIKDDSGVVHLSWPEPDNSGSPITGYRIYRGTTGGGFPLLAATTQRNYDDTAAANPDYLYRVTAVNGIGEGPYVEVKPTSGSGPSPCDSPGVSVIKDLLEDGSDNDAGSQVPPDPRVNVREVFLAEPYMGAGVNKLVFTIQTAPSSFTTAPSSSQWYILWNRLQPTATSDRMFVAMKSDVVGNVSFKYGEFSHSGTVDDPSINTPTDLGDADAGTYNAQTGVITITISTSKIENVQAGQQLAGLNARTFLARPEVGQRGQNTANDITDSGAYTLVGNGFCNHPPTAALSASPLSGTAPLLVNFSGSGSNDPDSVDTIASYTFNFGDGSAPVTQSGATISHIYSAAGTFTASLTVTDSGGAQSKNTASVQIQVGSPPPPCLEDNDPRIAYSGGWHLINYTSASDGHFRYHTGNNPNHSATLDFSVPSGSTGSITYTFAKSPKGGTADIYLDGVKRQTINYAGSVGSTQAPEFRPEYNLQLTGLAAGNHRLEIKNMRGAVYVDQFCLTSSTVTSQPATGPGNTTNQSGNASVGQTTSTDYQPQSGSQEMSVTVESTLNVPFKIALVSPSGLTLQTVDAVSGIATISQPVTQGGTYVIQVVNVSLGPIQFTTTVTPLIAR
jgi:hypothetical protein